MVGGGVAILLGGVFWYAEINQAKTTFEAQSELSLVKAPEEQGETSSSAPTREEQAETPSLKVPEQHEEETSTKTPEEREEAPAKSPEESEPKSFAIKESLVAFGHESASGRKIDVRNNFFNSHNRA